METKTIVIVSSIAAVTIGIGIYHGFVKKDENGHTFMDRMNFKANQVGADGMRTGAAASTLNSTMKAGPKTTVIDGHKYVKNNAWVRVSADGSPCENLNASGPKTMVMDGHKYVKNNAWVRVS